MKKCMSVESLKPTENFACNDQRKDTVQRFTISDHLVYVICCTCTCKTFNGMFQGISGTDFGTCKPMISQRTPRQT